jgi:hypothetical protein
VLRIGPQLDAAIRALTRPRSGHELQPVGRRARVATREHAHELLVRVIRRERVTELHLVEPFRVTHRRLLGIRARQAERFQARDLAHALRTHARIEHHDIAAHAVTHEIQRCARRQVIEERVEIGEIVGKPIAVVRSLRAPEAAHVHRDQRVRR